MENNSKEYKHTLSVITISRNEERNIGACIESVLEATREVDAEIILVDSASEDKTLEIAKRFPIRILQLEDKSQISPSAGRYVGFANSSGKYVQFIDADMTVDKKWISRAISFLEKADNSTAAVSGAIHQNETKCPYYLKLAKYMRRETVTKEVKELKNLFGLFMIKTNILQKIGSFSPNLAACEEGELSDRIYANSYRIILLPYSSGFHHVKEKYPFMPILKRRLKFRISEGEVLRRSLLLKKVFLNRLLLYKYHVLFVVFAILGLLSVAIFFILRFPHFIYLWSLFLILFFTYLMIREKGNIKNSLYLFIVYLSSWIFLARGFLMSSKGHQEPTIKKIKS